MEQMVYNLTSASKVALDFLGQLDTVDNKVGWHDFPESNEEIAFNNILVEVTKVAALISRGKVEQSLVADFAGLLGQVAQIGKAVEYIYSERRKNKDAESLLFVLKIAQKAIRDLNKTKEHIQPSAKLTTPRPKQESKKKPERLRESLHMVEIKPKTVKKRAPVTDPTNNYWLLRLDGNAWGVDALRYNEQFILYPGFSTYQEHLDEDYFHIVKPGDKGLVYFHSNANSIVCTFIITQGIAYEAGDPFITFQLTAPLQAPVQRDRLQPLLDFWDGLEADLDNKLFPISKAVHDKILEMGGEIPDVLIQNQLYASMLDNDNPVGAKDFFFTKDVRAFATIMALKNVKPPMAIALFGHWGTGKSFFMNRLQESIRQLSKFQCFPNNPDKAVPKKPAPENPFCEGIVHIQFNAWSYLDSNLWAGLISTIFEKLDLYITAYSKPGEAKDKVFARLGEELQIVSDQKVAILKEKTTLQSRKDEIEQSIKDHGAELNAIKTKEVVKSLEEFAGKARQVVQPDIDRISQKLNKYGITNEKAKHLSPVTLYEEVKSWSTFASNLFTFRAHHWLVIVVLLFGLGYIIIDPFEQIPVFRKEVMAYVSFGITLCASSIAKLIETFNHYRKLLEPLRDIRDKFNASYEDARSAHMQKLQLLQVEKEDHEKALNKLEQELGTIDKKIAYVEHSLTHSITRMAFDSFIRERRGDVNYEKHLGIISTIRRDFETLSTLFQDSIDEAEKNDSEEEDENLDDSQVMETDTSNTDGSATKGQTKKLAQGELRQYFKKPLDRIILYVDDLDRCPDDKVMEVLQAVHLLMAFPLFMVVVGVDKRCVYNALMHRNLLQYRSLIPDQDLKTGLRKYGMSIIEPGEYLEKIFQIPFHLDKASGASIQELVHDLLEKQVNWSGLNGGKETTVIDAAGTNGNDTGQNRDSKERVVTAEESDTVPKQGTNTTEGHGAKEAVVADFSPASLQLSREEFKQLKEISLLVGNTPRTIKRFINMYRIIRAHELLSYQKAKEQETFLLIMFTLALSIGDFRERASVLLDDILSKKDVTFEELLEQKGWREVEARIHEQEILNRLKPLTCGQAHRFVPMAKRFSFGHGVGF